MAEYWPEEVEYDSKDGTTVTHRLLFEVDFGLEFEGELSEVNRHFDIVTVGDANCGTTQLIEGCFKDHPTFRRTPCEWHDLYEIRLQPYKQFFISIYNVKDMNFLRREFRDKTVFIFCYDVDSQESFDNMRTQWISVFWALYIPGALHFVVGLVREAWTNLDDDARMDREERIDNMRREGRYVLSDDGMDLSMTCNFPERDSMLNIFQTAIDIAFPRASDS